MNRFTNPHTHNLKRRLWNFLLWKAGYYHDEKSLPKVPDQFHYPFSPLLLQEKEPKVMWIGHSTFLVEYSGVGILTDPIWSEYCSPIPFFGPRRLIPTPISIDELPQIDFVLISHNHYDHLDRKTVIALIRRFPTIQWVIPIGVKKWFKKIGIENTYELSWWKEISLQNEKNHLTITATPTQHFSGRGLFDGNTSLWNGYVVKMDGKTLYFAGDTGYNPHDFKEIGKKWGGFDLSLIPIGTYSPKEFMQPVHIGPEEAVLIHKEVQSKFSIGMHWKTFHLSDEPLQLPPYHLYLAMQKAHLPHKDFIPLDPGLYINW